jgi:hypothetical protein
VIVGATTRRLRFLPHPFAEHGVELAITSGILDGQRAATSTPDLDRHLFDLAAQRFLTITMRVEAALRPDVLASVLPERERLRPPAAVFVTTRCAATHLREVIPMSGSLTSGRLACTVSMRRADLLGVVEVGAMLLRTTSADTATEEYAAERGARIASARPWEVRIDAGAPPRGEFLDIRYVDFREADRAQFPNVGALYQLVTAGESPILWINSAHQRVCAALDGTGTSGRVARFRDVAFERLFHAVWLRLFLQSLRDLVRTGEPALAWQDAVLKRWLPPLYPDCADHESRVVAARRDVEDGDELDIIARLDSLLQVDRDTPRLLEVLAEEIEG